MELNSKQILLFNHCRVRAAVLGSCHRLSTNRSTVGVGVINKRSGVDAIEQPRVPRLTYLIPADMRYFQAICLKPFAPRAKYSQSGNFGSLAAAGKHPLHSDTDPEKSLTGSDPLLHSLAYAAVRQLSRSSKVSHSGKDDFVCLAHNRRIVCDDAICFQMVECLLHRRQVSRLVIDNRDHSSPFVLGNILASLWSREQAKRSARANALNSASSL